MQDLGHHAVAGRLLHAVALSDQLTHALACPAQRRSQIPLQGRVLINRSLSPHARLPNSLTARRFGTGFEFSQGADFYPARQSALLRHLRDSAKTKDLSFRHRDETPPTFVQDATEDIESMRQTSGVGHGCSPLQEANLGKPQGEKHGKFVLSGSS